MNAILSIKQQFVDEIIAGRKKYEFRKTYFKKKVEKIFIYVSHPVCLIIGEFSLGRVLEGTPEQLWTQTSDRSGVTKYFFDKYFMSHKIGFALEIKSFKKYKKPLNPYDIIKGFHAPQSFCYTNEIIEKIE